MLYNKTYDLSYNLWSIKLLGWFSSEKEWYVRISYLGSQIFYCVEDLGLTPAQPKYIGVDFHQYIQGIYHKI